MTIIERISRAEWLRDEIRMLDEALTATALPNGPLVSIERSQLVARRAERDRLQAELDDLSFGGRIDLRLTGEAVDDHSINIDALTDVLQPVRQLVERLGSSAFVSSRPGSYILEIRPSAEQRLDGFHPQLDGLGTVLSDIVSAGASPDVSVAVGSAVDDLSLNVIRSITSLVSNLRSQKLTLDFRWTNPTGKVRTGSLDPVHTGDLQRALRASEEDRSSRQVRGELRGLSLEGRRTFQIRVGDGRIVAGYVAKDAVARVVGFTIGEYVEADLEEISRTRTGASGNSTTRLIGLTHLGRE